MLAMGQSCIDFLNVAPAAFTSSVFVIH
jgi:hypothetical protein